MSVKHGSEILAHLPPLVASKSAFSERPKIVQAGAYTKAAPVKEERYCRRISDSIGNNYTPTAKDLSIKQISQRGKARLSSNPDGEVVSELGRNAEEMANTRTAISSELEGKNDSIQDNRSGKAKSLPPLYSSNSLIDRLDRAEKCSVRTFHNTNGAQTIQRGRSIPQRPQSAKKNPKEAYGSFEIPITRVSRARGGSGSRLNYGTESLNQRSRTTSPVAHTDRSSFSRPDSSSKGSQHGVSFSQVVSSTWGSEGQSDVPESAMLPEGILPSQIPSSLGRPVTFSEIDLTFHDPATQCVLDIHFPPSSVSTDGIIWSPLPEESCVDRYHHLIDNSMPNRIVAPMDQCLVSTTLQKVPLKLQKKLRRTTEALKREMEDEYFWSIKKSVLDYILLDPKEQRRLGISVARQIVHPAGREQFPWHQKYQESKQILEWMLFLTHPITLTVQNLWCDKYDDFRLINLADIFVNCPMTIEQFCDLTSSQFQDKRHVLQSQWMVECIRLVTEKKNLLEDLGFPSEENRASYFDHFFSSLATLMSQHVRFAVTSSLKDVSDLLECYERGSDFSDGNPELPVLPQLVTIYLVVDIDYGNFRFIPSINEVIKSFHSVCESLVTSTEDISRIEKYLFHVVEGVNVQTISTVKLDEDVVIASKEWVKTVITRNQIGPQRYCKLFERFRFLINQDADQHLGRFLQEEHSLTEYEDEISRLRALSRDIALMDDAVPFNFFLLDCRKIKGQLIEKAEQLISTLITKIVNESFAFNQSICQEYEDIVATINAIPESTDHLVELTDYIENIRFGPLLALREQLEVAAENLLFLMDHAVLTTEHISLNRSTFSWSKNLEPIIKANEMRMLREHETATNRLNERKSLFENQLQDTLEMIAEFKSKERMSEATAYVEVLNEVNNRVELFINKKKQINHEEILLNLEPSSYTQIEAIISLKERYDTLWRCIVSFTTKQEEWLNGNVLALNAEEIREEISNLWRTSYKLTKQFNQPDTMGPLRAAATIKTRIEKFKINLPLINALCAPGIKERHWVKMSERVGSDIAPTEDTKLSEMLSLGLERWVEDLSEISMNASKEHALEKALEKMHQDWESLEFLFVDYKDSGVGILSTVEDIQAVLDDHIVKTQTMRGSPFVGPVETEIKNWEAQLISVRNILESWLAVQSAWLYLEPVFSSEDIQRQMPNEGAKFRDVDGYWREIMANSTETPNVLAVTSQKDMLERLQYSEKLLEDIQKGLNEYLEQKRLFFPRFFFLSNDELLEILSETRDPTRVQPHLKKCFEGIVSLDFDDNKNIYGMMSAEGERVGFVEPIYPGDAKGLVEKWLYQVERIMRLSLQAVAAKAIEDYPPSKRTEWVQAWPGQIVLACSQVFWTADVTEAIGGKTSLSNYLQQCNNQIEEIVRLVRGSLSRMSRITLGSLIVIDVHARDVVQQLLESKVGSEKDFGWISQLRYYFTNKLLSTRMITTQVDYGYEYLGNSGRLVITPLTDRCYRTLMGAFQLHMGGAPEGPAGTGKTETCKDLAKAVAKQCVVYNCSDGLDYKAMGKFFKGLAQSGAWACFDEFNRIELEVLSVVAQQIQSIQQAVLAGASTFSFEGTEISLERTCAIYITMNPGYAGRAELPDNLKVLFRPVAMMVPDYAMIAEISLYSMGFVSARDLAAKVVVVYRLCSQQLSSQPHYDYGMRAVKSVLTAAGNLRPLYPEEREEVLLLRSIIDVNLPKFLAHDIPLFQGIIADLFPGLELPPVVREEFDMAVMDSAAKLHLQPTPWFLQRITQMYEMMLVRHGFMIVGNSVGGKTSAIKVLANALTVLARVVDTEYPVRYRIINPKSMTMGELYGSFDPVSHEWSDGVLANTFREHANSTARERKWIVFDGPVDAIWIENMNTVLDDNKKLCLMSGEIIQMSPNQTMIFEPENLDHASPATVSRCGMIYIEPNQLGWQPLFKSWLEEKLPPKVTENQANILEVMAEWLIPPVMDFVKGSCQMFFALSPMVLMNSFLRMFSATLDEFREDGKRAPSRDGLETPIQLERRDRSEAENTHWLQSLFLFAICWSFGGALEGDSRLKFSDFIKRLCSDDLRSHPRPKDLKLPRNVQFPGKGLVYDFYFDKATFGTWHPWEKSVVVEPIPKNAKPSEIIICTVETVRQKYFLDLFISHENPLLIVGPTGTGKSSITNHHILEMDKTRYMANFVNFSAQTTTSQTRDMVLSKLDRRKRGVLGPPQGKKVILFVDDVNMPAKEQYGAQPPIEALRQMLDHGYWFSRKDTSDLYIEDQTILGAMGPPGGGRNEMTERFIRHFNVIGIQSFSAETMKSIFEPVVSWHFDSGFETSLKRFSRIVIHATLSLYQKATQTFLPTPTKSHYVFNLRDFSRVVQGILLFPASANPSAGKITRLWMHEVYRVFYDRLVSEEDREKCFQIVKGVLAAEFKEKMNDILGHLLPSGQLVKDQDVRGLLFGDYAQGKTTNGIYDEIRDLDLVQEVMEGCLEDFNVMSQAPMDLVLFRFAIEHMSRISRILRQPKGHALLVGIGGSGRSSLTKLVSFMGGYDLFQIEVTKSYSFEDWRNDLRSLFRKTGIDCLQTVFLIGDHQIKEELFLEDINMVLNTGDIPNLFEHEEKAEIVEKMQIYTQEMNITIDSSPLSMYNYFIERVCRNLHVVITMSPVGDAFRNRLRVFPSLINCCTIDWFEVWPEDALEMVANKFLDDVEMPQAVRTEVVKVCKHFHQSTRELSERFSATLRRYNYVTPTSYLELMKAFKALLGKKRFQLLTQKHRYVVGVEKLEFAASQVAVMQEELRELQPELESTKKETEALLVELKAETEEVEKIKKVVEADENVANEQAQQAQAIRDECQKKLAVAIPALNAAIQALDTLKQQDITLVKAMQHPPAGVKMVMEAVCILKGVKPMVKVENGKQIDDYWGASKKVLGDLRFLDSLKEFDKDNIPAKVMQKIREKYVNNKDFHPSLIKNVSSACEGLCSWVRAIEVYDRVAKLVAPKRKRLKEAESLLEQQMSTLNTKRQELAKILARFETLKEDYSAKAKKKEELGKNIQLCSEKLMRAERLLAGLGGEKSRWIDVSEELIETYNNIVGDVLISAGLIAYLGAFTIEFRQDCIQDWHQQCDSRGIPVSKTFSFSATLGDAITTRDWHMCGLPADNFSLDNGIIATNSQRWPLFIDPQNQANKWIKNLENKHHLQVLNITDKNYIQKIENCVQFGTPILLESIMEELDPVLDPLLLKQIFRQGGMDYIRLRENTIQFSRDFRLYMTTKLSNPHYLPEVAVKVTLINFMITPSGLEDQLLGLVVAKEKPDLEKRRNQLITESADNKRQLKEIEDKILQILSSAKGNILEDETAIEVLSSSKELSKEILLKQKVTMKTEQEINHTRNGYKPVSKHSSILFFAVSDLACIEPTYQYSLSWFINLYLQSIESSEKSTLLGERVGNLNHHFTYSIYLNVCRSLFSKDKLLFSFLLAIGICRGRDEVNDEEWRFLLTGGVGLENPYKNPASDWLSEKSWEELVRCSYLPQFQGLWRHVTDNPQTWKAFVDSYEPHKHPLPEPWESQLSTLQRMVILRCLRPDKITFAIQDFVVETLGKEYIEPPAFDLAQSYDDSSNDVPLVFILSPGADPMAQLLKFAKDKGMTGHRCATISLGQGQGPLAEKIIARAVEGGAWVVLQNCHLAESWLPSLERICTEDLPSENTHSNFRLWLTTYPSTAFPMSILQNGVKVINEPPKGLRANLLRSYHTDPFSDSDFFTGCKRPKPWRRLLFGLCFFHALVQERKQFSSLGWNIPYEFNESDLRISARQLELFLDDATEIPFDALLYLTGECNYGGRVTDDFDRRLIRSMLRTVFNEDAVSSEEYYLCPAKTYLMYDGEDYESYINYIRSLPLETEPEVFGLHANADITKSLTETWQLFDEVLQTLPRQMAVGGKTAHVVVEELARDVLSKLPPLFDIGKVQKKYPVMYEESINTVLVQELMRFNKLSSIIRKSLEDLCKALKGLLLMSAELEGVYGSIVVGKVPPLWLGYSYPSLKPLGGYLGDLLNRLQFFETWIKNGPPHVFWISGFFFTQSFLTGILQNYARNERIPIDQLAYEFQVMKTDEKVESKPNAGAYIDGLFMEGAKWNEETECLGESLEKVLHAPMPKIWLRPNIISSITKPKSYACPVYKTSARRGVLSTTGLSTNYVLTIDLPSKEPEDHWVRRSVALLCQVDN